jgi:hypothetical protein
MRNTQKGGRKWSMKYKKSINCKNPKGLEQDSLKNNIVNMEKLKKEK